MPSDAGAGADTHAAATEQIFTLVSDTARANTVTVLTEAAQRNSTLPAQGGAFPP